MAAISLICISLMMVLLVFLVTMLLAISVDDGDLMITYSTGTSHNNNA
jgi:hypothetical protein